MSHDLYAAWATTAVASAYRKSPEMCFARPPQSDRLSVTATREGGRKWPVSDGVIVVESDGKSRYDLGLELKRSSEGMHGVLTAIGQGHAYLHKGFSGAVLVIPKHYDSYSAAAEQLAAILESTSSNLPIALFCYTEPDTSQTSPFDGKMECLRKIRLDDRNIQPVHSASTRTETLWGHVREGSTDPHALFLYLQVAKTFVIGGETDPNVRIPKGIVDACQRMAVKGGILKFLSNSSGDTFHDKVWRFFWFKYIARDTVKSCV